VTNCDHRIKGAIAAGNERLTELGIEPISERITPYSLSRTYASLRAACGDDPVDIAQQLGHEDPGFTFRVYQRAVKRRSKLSGAHLREYDRALEWATIRNVQNEKAANGQQPNGSRNEAGSASSGGSLDRLEQAIKSPPGR
jgi:hypothetical protein